MTDKWIDEWDFWSEVKLGNDNVQVLQAAEDHGWKIDSRIDVHTHSFGKWYTQEQQGNIIGTNAGVIFEEYHRSKRWRIS